MNTKMLYCTFSYFENIEKKMLHFTIILKNLLKTNLIFMTETVSVKINYKCLTIHT